MMMEKDEECREVDINRVGPQSQVQAVHETNQFVVNEELLEL